MWLRTIMASSSLDTFFAPPLSVRGMKVLERASFRREVVLPAIKLRPALCSKLLHKLKHVTLKYPGIKTLLNAETLESEGASGRGDAKVLLLTPEQLCEKPLSEDDVKWIVEQGGEMTSHSVTLQYQNYTKHAILRAVLPLEIREVPSAFEVVGHIAHVNLRKDQLPYKEIIGQVLLDKQSNIQTVVNKTDTIDGTFRFFKMELLAGEDNLVATVKENGCTFKFDFSKVYWNSRLHTEHERIVKMVNKGDVILDVFAGVGPFAIPACKKGCIVYANDLNPSSFSALCENGKLNGVSDRLKTYNMDGREFIKVVTHELVTKGLQSDLLCVYSHVIMNLPALAIEFLDSFQGLFNTIPSDLQDSLQLPTIHCYSFSKSEFPMEDALRMVERQLGVCLKKDTFTVSKVRNVAPSKDMMRISFTLPAEVAYSARKDVNMSTYTQDVAEENDDGNSSGEPLPKKCRLD